MERVDWTDPDLQRLVGDQETEVDSRYGDPEHDSHLDAETVTVAVLARDEDGTAIACGVLRDPAPAFEPGTGELNRMYVHPDHRRRGIGKEILRALEAAAHERKLGQLVLETGIQQPEAIGLYTSEGYRIIDNYPPYEDEDDSRCFAKAIGAEG
ncbi:GNAT family N-acetyltransferase [Ruania halotolerans]|uniref:GNAT family N-acetyltransferase n=1 Tax=Ruania halotolerans TaxID=2897773 RepID=UPI001E504A0D|nr:GNAT family N-acetyltransferase [Ruania halotolerans]UFU06406.1 GNAT family N-acetyltransferase [Ruania halotolerans]